jgi:predicted transcriptional regulator YheO
MEVSKLVQVRDLLNGIIDGPKKAAIIGTLTNKDQPIEDLHTSIEGLTTSIILKTLSGLDIPPDRMSQDEKVDIVRKLNDQGVFLIKGAVTEVASHLKTSEATVYRYLNKIDAKHSL